MNHTNTTHFKLNLLKSEDAIQGHITFSLLLLLCFLCLIITWTDSFKPAGYKIALGGWCMWMFSTTLFFITTIDIDFIEGFDNRQNQFEIINAAFITIQLVLFLMNCIWYKYDRTKRYVAVSTQDVEDFNKL